MQPLLLQDALQAQRPPLGQLAEAVVKMWKQDPELQKQQALDQQQRDTALQLEKSKRAAAHRRVVWVGIAVVALVSIAAAFALVSQGKYDAFAKCLTEKGAVMYGEDWCPYTQGQKTMFGKSFKHVNYLVKTDLNKRPTWVIDGQSYEGVQSFDTLASLTGCRYN